MDTFPTSRLGLILDAQALARLTTAAACIGMPGFHRALWEVFRIALDFDAGGSLTFYTDRPPAKGFLVYDLARRPGVGPNENTYFEGPYVFDPIYQLFRSGRPSGLYRLADEAPDNFRESEYYRGFYAGNAIQDSLELIWRIDERSAVLMFFEREQGSPPFNHLEIQAVQQLLDFAFASLRRHHALILPEAEDQLDRLLHKKVQATIDYFGSSVLTPRESEVLFYMLSGYSVTRTAEKLNVAEGTVKIHRNNIHRKLEINSQAELFSLFIRCIPFASPDQAEDPLVRYASTPATRQ